MMNRMLNHIALSDSLMCEADAHFCVLIIVDEEKILTDKVNYILLLQPRQL